MGREEELVDRICKVWRLRETERRRNKVYGRGEGGRMECKGTVGRGERVSGGEG